MGIDYYTISAAGVVQMFADGSPAEFSTVGDWVREHSVFNMMKQVSAWWGPWHHKAEVGAGGPAPRAARPLSDARGSNAGVARASSPPNSWLRRLF